MNVKEHKLAIWTISKQKREVLIRQGLDFLTRSQPQSYQEQKFSKIEIGVNARYLHRGYYCPSPVHDIIVENARRGKILERLTKRSKPTHRFYFDMENRLIIAETIFNDGSIQTEYLVYTSEYIYGYVFDSQNNLVGVSEEYYHDSIIQHYFRASCFNKEILSWYQSVSKSISSIDYETYRYDKNALSEADYCYASRWSNTPNSADEAQSLFFIIHYTADGSISWR